MKKKSISHVEDFESEKDVLEETSSIGDSSLELRRVFNCPWEQFLFEIKNSKSPTRRAKILAA
jgi:hypothetical protein